jgi:acetoin utilization deacetylase AcuC-like enzyme
MTDSKILLVHSAHYDADIGTHIFRTEKFGGVRRTLLESASESFAFVEPPDYARTDFAGFFTPEYEEDLFTARESPATLRSELPVTPEIIHWQLVSAIGTYLAGQAALRDRISGHIGGGLHHACPDHAEGFCYVNDLAYAIWRLRKDNAIRTALVMDCDLHQGNGTAEYFGDDPRVFTFSIHDEWNYPMPKSRSTLDIGLPPGTDGTEYLRRLRSALDTIFSEFRPDMAIYQAGVDPYHRDQLGSLRLTADDLKERDHAVLEALRSRSIPTVITLGGGYPPTLEELVSLHAQTLLVASQIWLSHAS